MIDKKILEILACPLCKSELEYKNEALKCKKCMLRYQIRDGVPVMLPEQAEKLEGEDV